VTTCLAVIPARGGSKRLPKKNVRHMRGRPLLAYTVEAAAKSGLFERVIVTTDSSEIAEIARATGAEVPFLRDPTLADDVTPVSLATIDVLERLGREGQHYEHVCQLMPNCPLRTAEDVVASYRQFLETSPDSQISVVRFGWQNPWWAMQLSPDLTVEPLFAEAMAQRSQDLPELFCPTGAVWWARSDALQSESTFHMPGRTGWEIHWIHGMDIDTEDDWLLTDVLMGLAESGNQPGTS
jgi:CMP-N-acetylneuraminic acid synthetase